MVFLGYMKDQQRVTTGIAILALLLSIIALVQKPQVTIVGQDFGSDDVHALVNEDVQPVLEVPIIETSEDLSYVATFSVASQTAGVGGGTYALQRVRHADHDVYYRFVFDVVDIQGNPVSGMPFVQSKYLLGTSNITIMLSDFVRDYSGNAPIRNEDGAIRESAYQSVGAGPVLGWYRDLLLDDSGLRYSIDLTEKVPYNIQVLQNPTRVVVDILK
jgi:hypothetical protein